MRVWLARAAAAVVAALIAYLGVEVLNTADENGDRTADLQQQLEATPPASADQVAELGDRVDALPTEAPTRTVVVTAPPVPGPAGPAGPAGPPGAPGATGPKGAATNGPDRPSRPTAARPRPTVTITATPAPAPCRLLGMPLDPQLCAG